MVAAAPCPARFAGALTCGTLKMRNGFQTQKSARAAKARAL